MIRWLPQEMEQPASQRASLQLDVCPPQRSRSRRPFPAAVVAVVAGLAVVQLLSGAPGVCGNVLKRNEAALRSEGHTYAEPGQILETLQVRTRHPPRWEALHLNVKLRSPSALSPHPFS